MGNVTGYRVSVSTNPKPKLMATVNATLWANAQWQDRDEQEEESPWEHYGLHPRSTVWCFMHYGIKRWGVDPQTVGENWKARQQFAFGQQVLSGIFPAQARSITWQDDLVDMDLLGL